MITVEEEREILKLFSEGMKRSEIERRTGIHFFTVRRVCEYGKVRPRSFRMKGRHKILKASVRCEVCGGMIKVWPCLMCNPGAYREDEIAELDGPFMPLFRRSNDIVGYLSNVGEVDQDEMSATLKLVNSSPKLFRLLLDFVELDELGIIGNVLFTSLSSKARKTLTKIDEGLECHLKNSRMFRNWLEGQSETAVSGEDPGTTN